MKYKNKQDLIKSKEVLSWWKQSGETTKKGKSDYRTPINIDEPEVEREDSDRGELYRTLQKITDLYYKIIAGVAPVLRKELTHDEKKYKHLILTLQDHVANKIKQEPKTDKPYVQIGDLVRLYGDVDGYNKYFKNTQRQMNKVLKTIATELNQVATGNSPEPKGDAILLGMKEEVKLDLFKRLLEDASLEELNDKHKLLEYISHKLIELKYSDKQRYSFLEWIQSEGVLTEDLPTGTDVAYKTGYNKRPSAGSFPYAPDAFSMDTTEDEKERIKYAFDGVDNYHFVYDPDDIEELINTHNMTSDISDDENAWLGEINDLIGYEPVIIGSKAFGTALEDGSSDIDTFIAVPNEEEFERVSQILGQTLNSSKFNDTEYRHPQNRIFSDENFEKQIGVGYGPEAEAMRDSIFKAKLKLSSEQREQIKQAKEDAAAVEDAAEKSYRSLKYVLDTLIGVERMEPPVRMEEATGVYGGQETTMAYTLPPEQRGKHKVPYRITPKSDILGKEVDAMSPGKRNLDYKDPDVKRSDAIDAHDIHSRPAAQNTQAKMTGDGARRNDATGFVNKYLQQATSQEKKQKLAGRAMGFSNPDDMEFDDIDKVNKSDLENDVEETVDIVEKDSIYSEEVFDAIKQVLPQMDLIKINKFYNVSPNLSLTDNTHIEAHYDFDHNTIHINPNNVNNIKDFLLCYLHELQHAQEAQKRGVDALKEDYEREIEKLQLKLKDNVGWYTLHSQELAAENFAQQEIKKWL
tara:strand:- start:36 stop:2276 length:2241 start_codon:yes stop_codon:yes gene_type:complete